MFSRRYQIQERKKTKKAYFLLLLSVVFLIGLFFYGVPALAQLTSLVGDFRKNQEQAILEEDKTPPPPPTIFVMPTYTSSDTQTVSGLSEIGTLITIYNNDEEIKIIKALDSSSFSVDISLVVGKNRIWAIAQDQAGNVGEESAMHNVFYDTEPPTLEIIKPADGETFVGDDNKTIKVEGKTDSDAKVTINERLAIVRNSGDFSLAYTLSAGENTITIKAVGPAGNEIDKIIIVTFEP